MLGTSNVSNEGHPDDSTDQGVSILARLEAAIIEKNMEEWDDAKSKLYDVIRMTDSAVGYERRDDSIFGTD